MNLNQGLFWIDYAFEHMRAEGIIITKGGENDSYALMITDADDNEDRYCSAHFFAPRLAGERWEAVVWLMEDIDNIFNDDADKKRIESFREMVNSLTANLRIAIDVR